MITARNFNLHGSYLFEKYNKPQATILEPENIGNLNINFN